MAKSNNVCYSSRIFSHFRLLSIRRHHLVHLSLSKNPSASMKCTCLHAQWNLSWDKIVGACDLSQVADHNTFHIRNLRREGRREIIWYYACILLCTYNCVGYSACSMYCEQYVVYVQAHVVLVLDVVHIVTYAWTRHADVLRAYTQEVDPQNGKLQRDTPSSFSGHMGTGLFYSSQRVLSFHLPCTIVLCRTGTSALHCTFESCAPIGVSGTSWQADVQRLWGNLCDTSSCPKGQRSCVPMFCEILHIALPDRMQQHWGVMQHLKKKLGSVVLWCDAGYHVSQCDWCILCTPCVSCSVSSPPPSLCEHSFTRTWTPVWIGCPGSEVTWFP